MYGNSFNVMHTFAIYMPHPTPRRISRVSEEWKKKGKEVHTDFATKRTSSVSLSRSARAVASDRSGLYMLKKYSGTCSEKACDSIAKKSDVSQGCLLLRRRKRSIRRTPEIDV